MKTWKHENGTVSNSLVFTFSRLLFCVMFLTCGEKWDKQRDNDLNDERRKFQGNFSHISSYDEVITKVWKTRKCKITLRPYKIVFNMFLSSCRQGHPPFPSAPESEGMLRCVQFFPCFRIYFPPTEQPYSSQNWGFPSQERPPERPID